jgi:hypothetical protein
MSPNLHQVGDGDPLRAALRGVLLAAVESGPIAAGGIDSIQRRACAVLYSLLMDHPVDQRGRCQSCRRPGVVFGFRRPPLPGTRRGARLAAAARRRHRCRQRWPSGPRW